VTKTLFTRQTTLLLLDKFSCCATGNTGNNQTTVEFMNKLKNTVMKTLQRLSKKAVKFCELSNYDIDKVRESMKSSQFALEVCETKSEMDENGVDYSFPYVVFNPFNIDIDQQF
jgi:predicted transcriptional regulator